jgi:hypothetical protein
LGTELNWIKVKLGLLANGEVISMAREQLLSIVLAIALLLGAGSWWESSGRPMPQLASSLPKELPWTSASATAPTVVVGTGVVGAAQQNLSSAINDADERSAATIASAVR